MYIQANLSCKGIETTWPTEKYKCGLYLEHAKSKINVLITGEKESQMLRRAPELFNVCKTE